MRRFEHFACVDWSGANIARPPGIAVAAVDPSSPAALIEREGGWSRAEILDWLRGLACVNTDILIGFDLSMALPFVDEGSYFPGWRDSPADARALWALVDRLSESDAHLAVPSFLSHPQIHRHFRHGGGVVGDLFPGGAGRLRVVERHQRLTGQGSSISCLNLVGAAQVGKSSLTGMRVLHRLQGAIPVWPFDDVPATGPLLVEIYTTVAARAAGLRPGLSKIRDREALNAAFDVLGAPRPVRVARYDDHKADALLTAAWLQRASRRPELWRPPALTPEVARKEGWTFGIA